MNISKNVRPFLEDWSQISVEETDRMAYIRLMENRWFSTRTIFICFTIFFACISFVLPWLFLRSPNRNLITTCLLLAGVCCWLFWTCTYLAQWHPLIGPKLSNKTLLLLGIYYDDPYFWDDIETWTPLNQSTEKYYEAAM